MAKKISTDLLAQLVLTKAQTDKLAELTAKKSHDVRKFHVHCTIAQAVELKKAHPDWRIEIGNTTDADLERPEMTQFLPKRAQ